MPASQPGVTTEPELWIPLHVLARQKLSALAKLVYGQSTYYWLKAPAAPVVTVGVAKIADYLGVSPRPVRVALHALERAALIRFDSDARRTRWSPTDLRWKVNRWEAAQVPLSVARRSGISAEAKCLLAYLRHSEQRGEILTAKALGRALGVGARAVRDYRRKLREHPETWADLKAAGLSNPPAEDGVSPEAPAEDP